MWNEDEVRYGLRELISAVEEQYFSGEGKLTAGDVLKLIQHGDLDEKMNPPEHVSAQWVRDQVDVAA